MTETRRFTTAADRLAARPARSPRRAWPSVALAGERRSTLIGSVGSDMLAPFQVRSFRFQFPADLLTSWALEMENLVLGWYILVETGSVFLLTVLWALQYLGTLLAPVLGMAGDRVGHRSVLCAMRAWYTVLSILMTSLALSGALHPAYALAIAGFAGLVRPADWGMRNAVVGDTMPADTLMATMGLSRTTADSARIAGALAGAGLFAWLGLGPVYFAIACCYAIGFLFTLGIAGRRSGAAGHAGPRPSFWRDLKEGLAFVWDTPASLAAMWLAFLVNLTAFPLTSGLLPYIAKNVYQVDQTGLGTLMASFALGSLIGSIAVSLSGRRLRAARMMIVFALCWYAMLLGFVAMPGPSSGRLMLIVAGVAQSLCMVPMSVMLLHSAGERFRGRVMGVRMMAIYGVPIGLLIAGFLIERVGFAPTAALYCVFGLAMTALIGLRWRGALWPLDAPANAR
jgi:Na+/melibiose symporter-like transporter